MREGQGYPCYQYDMMMMMILRLKIDFVSYPARAEGLGKYGISMSQKI